MLGYPVTLTPENGGYVVTFQDVPEALTEGDTLEEALAMGLEALESALEFYYESHRPVPVPSAPGPGQHVVFVPPWEAGHVHAGRRAEQHTSQLAWIKKMRGLLKTAEETTDDTTKRKEILELMRQEAKHQMELTVHNTHPKDDSTTFGAFYGAARTIFYDLSIDPHEIEQMDLQSRLDRVRVALGIAEKSLRKAER
jgi:predicted RNase H-like HicB family nuclease/uncharacterized protein YnzC (UPF0291/DUF896 family)